MRRLGHPWYVFGADTRDMCVQLLPRDKKCLLVYMGQAAHKSS